MKTITEPAGWTPDAIVRLQRERERREVCWICLGTGRDLVGAICVYCGGFGSIHVEVRT